MRRPWVVSHHVHHFGDPLPFIVSVGREEAEGYVIGNELAENSAARIVRGDDEKEGVGRDFFHLLFSGFD